MGEVQHRPGPIGPGLYMISHPNFREYGSTQPHLLLGVLALATSWHIQACIKVDRISTRTAYNPVVFLPVAGIDDVVAGAGVQPVVSASPADELIVARHS